MNTQIGRLAAEPAQGVVEAAFAPPADCAAKHAP
jgi:hypothetical protein